MHYPTPYNAFISLLVIWIAYKFFLNRRRNARLIRLKGPPNDSFLFGSARKVLPSAKDRDDVIERWIAQYGPVFQMSIQLGERRVIVGDPKAVGHIFSKDTFTYFRPPFARVLTRTYFGPSMLFTEGEDHRRQRKALSPAFSNAALRAVTSVFYDAAHKAKANWSSLFESSDEAIIDVQKWMNRITLDSIGIAGFGYDFRALEGFESPVLKGFESFNKPGSGRQRILLLGPIFPHILKIPTERTRVLRQMSKATSDMAVSFLENSQSEKESAQYLKDKSILGLLVKGESDDANFKLNHDETVSQINLLLFAGYETTAISLSWALVELARNLEIQRKLRDELSEFASSDPTYDQLMSGLLYLDAVVHETLRLHPPVGQLGREAVEDDIVPLGSPIETASGQMIDSLFVPEGTKLTIPISFINRSEQFWGPDASSFVPERWLKENPYMPKELHGHRHLLTFVDGPRICLGRGFALAEFKAVLSVLVRNFSFELLNGPDTELDVHVAGFLPRPKSVGEADPVLSMRVRQVIG